MAPTVGTQGFQHRVRRMHPLRPVASRNLRRLDRAGADDIMRYQQRRLRVLVTLAAHRSPFYREWFRHNNIDPGDIRAPADLALLPLLGRDELVSGADRFRTYPRHAMWPAHSSGTTGRVVTTYRTPGSSLYEMCILERQWSWFGLPRGARRVILRGSDFAADRTGPPVRSVPGGQHMLVSSFHLTPDTIPAVLEAIRTFRPHAVEGWPSSITLLAALIRERGARLPLQGIITSSEVTTPAQQKLMREVFDGPIIDHYGQTERVVLAGTCEEGGYHIFPDYGITELIPVPGAIDRWEIVGTALHNFGFPLFRYRTGDEVGPPVSGTCPCGRAFPLLGRIDGRVEDTFSTADGRPLPLPGTVIDDLPGLREAQIAQLAPGRFELRVVPGAGFDAARVEATIRRNVDRCFGPGQGLSIVTMDAIPRRPGSKLKSAVVENRPSSPARP